MLRQRGIDWLGSGNRPSSRYVNSPCYFILEAPEPEDRNLDSSFGEEWDGAPKHSCPDLVYKFTINNKSGTPIHFKIGLSQKDASE